MNEEAVRSTAMWGSLTREVGIAGARPRKQLDRLLQTAGRVQRDYRDSVGPLLVGPQGASPGTLGSAFDLWLQMQATPRPPLTAATRGARRAGPRLQRAFHELVGLLAAQPNPQPLPGSWAGPSKAVSGTDLLRLCWAAALFVEVYRLGGVVPGSPLFSGTNEPSAEDLMHLAAAAAVAELGDLAALAGERLLPELTRWAECGPTWLGPDFRGSEVMDADADIITGKSLLELKTGLGVTSGATRRASLEGATLRQLVAYVLHDYDDDYALGSAALYQARYGHLAVWPLDELLSALAGWPVNLTAERASWRAMLLGA